MKLSIEIPDEDVPWIEEILAARDEEEPIAGLPRDIKQLARMLLGDVALAARRPGSWEGANMLQVLASHGYKV